MPVLVISLFYYSPKFFDLEVVDLRDEEQCGTVSDHKPHGELALRGELAHYQVIAEN